MTIRGIRVGGLALLLITGSVGGAERAVASSVSEQRALAQTA
jgi:hypothetical protein